MDNIFLNLSKQLVHKPQQEQQVRKNPMNLNRKAMKQINKPSQDFSGTESKQNNRVFHANPTDWSLQVPSYSEKTEKISTTALPPQEVEIQVFHPIHSDFILPSDDELQELPDLKETNKWPDLLDESNDSDSIVEDSS